MIVLLGLLLAFLCLYINVHRLKKLVSRWRYGRKHPLLLGSALETEAPALSIGFSCPNLVLERGQSARIATTDEFASHEAPRGR